jgi:hypothetical protein
VHALDVGGRERLRHDANCRDHARHGALEAHLHATAAGGVEDLLTVLREQLLVGGHHVTTRVERAQHVVARRLDAAHQLDDQIAALDDVVEVAAAAREHTGDLGPPANLGLDRVRPLLEKPGEGRPDGAVAQHPDSKWFSGHAG